MRGDQLLAITQELDQLRAMRKPSEHAAERLLSLLTSGTAATYFFRRDFSNTDWLQPLKGLGAFQKYSRVRSARQRRWVIFRELAAYLYRVAETEPKQVADILTSLSTGDSWATGQFVKATLGLPDEQAARVVPQFEKWCRPGNPFAREEEVIDLADRMLQSGHETQFALLLTLLLKPLLSRQGQDVSGIFFEDRLVDFVRNSFQRFCSATPATCLRVADRCLRDAIPLRERGAAERWESMGMGRGRKPDPSSGLRSAIEEHEQNRFPGFEDGLVVAVRDALAAYVRESPAEAEETIRRYLRSKWSVFRRLAIHTLTENADIYPELAKSAALRRRFFEDTDLHHEYWRLMPRIFDDLLRRQRRRILSSVLRGREGADERQRKWFAHDRLYILRNCDLNAEARDRLDGLLAELGPPEHPDFLVYMGAVGSFEPEAPLTLEGKSADELYAFLDTWRPQEGVSRPFGPSYSGVARELRRVVRGDPSGYVALADKMTSAVAAWMADDSRRYWATYVGYTLDAYREACREGSKPSWDSVLGLADAVVRSDVAPAQWPDPEPREEDVPELGYDWCGLRHAVISLTAEGIDPEKSGPIPDERMPRVRDILIRLTRDPFPTPEYEHGHEQKNATTPNAAPVDWYQVAINTNRPEAANILLRYAVRHANPIVKERRNEPRVERKVRDALSALADDPCRSVHSTLGSWLGVLWWLDGSWLKRLLSSILPTSRDQHGLWEAAWVAFLRFGTLYPGLHEHLVPHYQRSISQCAGRMEDDPHLVGLCKHLAAIHTWRWEELADSESLILRFYNVAEDDAASELAEALGHFVRNLDKAGDDAPIYRQRIESLTRWRLELIRPEAADHVKELRAFATWLDAFVERGASDLAETADVLEVIASVPLGHWQFERVIDFLDAQAEAHPLIAARLLRQVLSKCDRDAWYWEREKVNSVLDKVFASRDPGVRRDAVKAIELLWEQGEWEPFERHRDAVEALV